MVGIPSYGMALVSNGFKPQPDNVCLLELLKKERGGTRIPNAKLKEKCVTNDAQIKEQRFRRFLLDAFMQEPSINKDENKAYPSDGLVAGHIVGDEFIKNYSKTEKELFAKMFIHSFMNVRRSGIIGNPTLSVEILNDFAHTVALDGNSMDKKIAMKIIRQNIPRNAFKMATVENYHKVNFGDRTYNNLMHAYFILAGNIK